MIDLEPLKKYIITLDEKRIESFKRSYLAYGFDECFYRQINSFINCEKTLSDGRRLMQTNDYRYNIEITYTLWLIENAFEEEQRDEYYKILLERHNRNLEFERINGFEYDPNPKNKKNKKNKISKNRSESKQNISDGAPKERKETAAERKLKAHIAKINALTFKPKSL